MNIQQKIKYLNNNLVSELLTIPKSILDTNKNDNEKLNLFFNYMVDRKIKFTGSKQPLHPNLVKFLVDNEICKPIRENNECYLESCKSKNLRIHISKCNLFAYELVGILRKNINKKKILKNFFDEENYVQGLEMEKYIKSATGIQCFSRIDLRLDVGGKDPVGKYISIEFLEKNHENEGKFGSGYQAIRIADIIHSSSVDSDDPYLSFLIIWDKYWSMEAYKSNWVDIICRKLMDYQLINNEDERIATKFNEEIQSMKISKILVKSFKNRGKACINAQDLIEGIYNIKDDDKKNKLIDKFKNRVKRLIDDVSVSIDLEDQLDNLLLTDSYENAYEDDAVKASDYYLEKNGDIYITSKGWSSMDKCLDFDDISSSLHRKIDSLQELLGYTAYKVIKDTNKIKDNLTKNLIIGLDHNDYLPEKFKKMKIKVNKKKLSMVV